MSRFTGKYDFSDFCESEGAENVLKKYKVYGHDNHLIPLALKEEKDLIPLYPYIVGMMVTDKNGGNVYLGEKSYIDIQEEDILKLELKYIKREYRRCKRKKAPFVAEIADNIREDIIELRKRVERDGEKADICGIHMSYYTKLRIKLCQEMIEHGYTESQARLWCFGWKYVYNGFNYSIGEAVDECGT